MGELIFLRKLICKYRTDAVHVGHPAPSPPHWEGSASHRERIRLRPLTASPLLRLSSNDSRRPEPLLNAGLTPVESDHPRGPLLLNPGAVLPVKAAEATLFLCARGSRRGAALWSARAAGQSEARTRQRLCTEGTQP